MSFEEIRADLAADAVLRQSHVVGGFEISVVDCVLDDAELAELSELAKGLRYQRSEPDRPGTLHRSMVAEFKLSTVFEAGFVRKIVAATRLVRSDNELEPYRAYMNNNTYGDMSYPHCDSPAGIPTVTTILYANHNWQKDWGGETLFYDPTGDIVACVQPRFGRLVIFDGEIEHKGSVPTRDCFEERLTFVVKLRSK